MHRVIQVHSVEMGVACFKTMFFCMNYLCHLLSKFPSVWSFVYCACIATSFESITQTQSVQLFATCNVFTCLYYEY